MNIFPNSRFSQITAFDHPVFILVEQEFYTWLKDSNPAMEYEDKYFSDEAIYNKTAAIRGAIEEMLGEAKETGKPVDIRSFDFDAVFA